MEHQYNTLQEKLNGKSEQEIREFFKASVNDKELNELASGGFLFGILTDPPNARKVNFILFKLSKLNICYEESVIILKLILDILFLQILIY